MKMPMTATLDDRFNKNLQKVQDGVQELMKLSEEFKKHSVRPVGTQLAALQVLAEDTAKLASRVKEIRG